MTDHFRVSIEGEQVERVLGELLVARSLLADISTAVMFLDVEMAEARGESVVWALRSDSEGLGSESLGPVSDRLEPLVEPLRDRLTAVIEYLRVDPD
jgi:hypothetical protein